MIKVKTGTFWFSPVMHDSMEFKQTMIAVLRNTQLCAQDPTTKGLARAINDHLERNKNQKNTTAVAISQHGVIYIAHQNQNWTNTTIQDLENNTVLQNYRNNTIHCKQAAGMDNLHAEMIIINAIFGKKYRSYADLHPKRKLRLQCHYESYPSDPCYWCAALILITGGTISRVSTEPNKWRHPYTGMTITK